MFLSLRYLWTNWYHRKHRHEWIATGSVSESYWLPVRCFTCKEESTLDVMGNDGR